MKSCLTLVLNQPQSDTQWQKKLYPLLDISKVNQRASHVWDFIIDGDVKLQPTLRETLYQQQIDFALQPLNRLPKQLFISDMDATLVVGETIDEMAHAQGVYPQVSEITAAAMRGELDYHQALTQRLALMKGMPHSAITQLVKNIQFVSGAQALLNFVNKKNIYSFLISGGFTDFTEYVSQHLGFQAHLANQLSYDNKNRLDGQWAGSLVCGETKGKTLNTLVKQLNISLSETVAIGDGANDKEMISQAGLGIAFYGKPILRRVANAEIHSGTIDNARWFF